MNPIYAILLSLVPPIFYGMGNMMDNKLTRFGVFRRTSTLVFIGNTTTLLFLPLLLVFGPISWPPVAMIPLLATVGIIEFYYLFPYYKSFKYLDTSVVAGLFSIAKVLTPILAFFVLGEALSAWQYLGFMIVIAAAVVLALEKSKKIKINKGFWLMLFASVMIMSQVVVLAKISESMDWVSLFFWFAVMTTGASSSLLLWKENRKNIMKALRSRSFGSYVPALLINEVFSSMAKLSLVFIITLLPVTLIEAGDAVQPILVLMMSYVAFKVFGIKVWEDKTPILRKSICFAFMVLGIFMLV
ncbi:MAG: DMT family transporter [Alphaproteobacteria bacterium]|nr:DMT family transporter [Alphaproteobacteria bacterium]